MIEIKDMPKLESPFIRKLNDKNEYLVTLELNQLCSWIFEGGEEDSIAAERASHNKHEKQLKALGQADCLA